MEGEFSSAQRDELAVLGHVLRTPLGVVSGYATIIADEELSLEVRRRACQVMLERCAELNELIRGFLDERRTAQILTGSRAGHLTID